MSNVNLQCDNCNEYTHTGFEMGSPRCPKCGSDKVLLDYDEDFREEADEEVDDYDNQAECNFS